MQWWCVWWFNRVSEPVRRNAPFSVCKVFGLAEVEQQAIGLRPQALRRLFEQPNSHTLRG
jgi:hypothetical protein